MSDPTTRELREALTRDALIVDGVVDMAALRAKAAREAEHEAARRWLDKETDPPAEFADLSATHLAIALEVSADPLPWNDRRAIVMRRAAEMLRGLL
jgi:hypothetical protein